MSSRHLVVAVASIAVLSSVGGIRAQQQPAEDKEHLDSAGSGFILSSSGYIATNHHVVAGATTLGVLIPGREKPVPAKVVVEDLEHDLAIIKADTTPLGNTPISLCDPAQVRIGQDTFVLGYPLPSVMNSTVRVTTGTISSLFGLGDDQSVYQITDPVQPGNSGGPLFNRDGQVVGVVVAQFIRPDGRAENVNFAIKGPVLATLLQRVPEGPEILKRNTKTMGSIDQQVQALSKWVVQVLNFRPTVMTATHEYRRPPSASTRVDLLGGRLAYYVDTAKWTEANPEKKGVPQQFVMTKGEARAGVMLEVDPATKPIEAMRENVMRELLRDLPGAQIANQEKRIVNGLPMLDLEIEASGPKGPIAVLVALYSGPEGSVRASAFIDRRELDKFKPEIEEALSGFEKPTNPSLTGAPWLTEWTRKAIRKIDSPVLMRVAAREPDVPRYQKVLSAYQDATPQIYIEYIDPEKSPELVRNIGLFGTGITEVNYQGRRLRTVVDGEIDVTKALMRLESGPQKVYFTQVHAERDLASPDQDGYATLAGWLDNNNYSLERLVPTADNKVPVDAAVVIAAGPKRDFTANQIASLKNYFAAGGRVLLLLDPTASGGPATPNLLAFAKELGIDVGNAVTEGGGNAVATTYASHPATLGFREPITFPLARAVTPAGGANARGAVTLIETKQATGLAAAVRSKPTTAPPPGLTAQPESRVVVIGNSDFIANANIKTGANAALFASVLAWMTEPVPPADLSK